MSKKVKSLILSFVLCLFAVSSIFCLAACGEVSLGTLEENFDALSEVYTKNNTVFEMEDVDGKKFVANVKYSDENNTINKLIASDANFEVLEKEYEVVFVEANKYIEKNKAFIIEWKEKISSQAQGSVNKLNGSVSNYIKQFDKFLDSHQVFETHFKITDSTNEAHLVALSAYKRAYGELINKALDVVKNLSDCIEHTKLFEYLSSTTSAEPDDSGVFQQYVTAKMLPVYNEVLINQTYTNLNWESTNETSFKEDFTGVLNTVKASFANYIQLITDRQTKTFESGKEAEKLIKQTENFMVEVALYNDALDKLDIKTIATAYENDIEKYVKKNELAKVYLEKIERFVNYVLPEYLEFVSTNLYVENV